MAKLNIAERSRNAFRAAPSPPRTMIPFLRSDFLVLGGLPCCHILGELFDVGDANVAQTLAAQQGNDVVINPGECVLLGQRLHRLPDLFAPLDNATALLVKPAQLGHQHLAALRDTLAAGILAIRCCAEDSFRFLARLFDRELPKAANGECSAFRGPTTSIYPISHDEGLRAARHNPQPEAGQLAIP
jgi:hypothetical protein